MPVDLTKKWCPKCSRWRGRPCFGRDNGKKDGLFGYCRPCATAHTTKWVETNREKFDAYQKAYHRNGKHGLTKARRAQILFDQDFRCPICKVPFLSMKLAADGRTPVCADHDHACCPGSHSCGKCIRGLICAKCNLVLGNAKDDVEILYAAIEYLISWAERD